MIAVMTEGTSCQHNVQFFGTGFESHVRPEHYNTLKQI